MSTDPLSLNLYNETRKETICFQSLDMILEKLRLDGTFALISQIFQKVIDKEMTFTITGNLIRAYKVENRNSKLGPPPAALQ